MKIILLLVAILFCLSADARIPRSHAAIAAFKHSHPCPSNHHRTGVCPRFTIDHFVPLACNGFDGVHNMRWMSTKAAKKKDLWERKECVALLAIENENGGIAPDQDFKQSKWYVDGPRK